MSLSSDIRVILGIDFGTTYSGFAYANKVNPEITTNETWVDLIGQYKVNTALQYDHSFTKVEAWGYQALAKKPSRRQSAVSNDSKPIELFKLHLGDIPDIEKPSLQGLDYKKAITDYLREIAKDTIQRRWPNIDFMTNVQLVLTVPAEFTEKAKGIMRECVFKANLINTLQSNHLQFTTEPEAAALYCMKVLGEYFLNSVGTSFLICDCGGGTVDLTTREVLEENKLSEITERSGGFCGGTYVDQEFVKYLRRKVGSTAIDRLKEKHYGQYQYMIQQFCKQVKIPFNGDQSKFKPIEFDLGENCPVIKQYVQGREKSFLEEEEWILELDFETVQSMFDPVVGKIIRLIRNQLNSGGNCPAMFLVGGFSESKYLQSRVKEEFGSRVGIIAVPRQPITAIVRGAVEYGLKIGTIKTRVLRYTYGVRIYPKWTEDDPPERKDNDRIYKFCELAKRGTRVDVDQGFSESLIPVYKDQTSMEIRTYITREYSATYCDEPGMHLLGTLKVDLPDAHLGFDRIVEYTLSFGKMEINGIAKNTTNGNVYNTTFTLDMD
ncbi:539_t:CDS:2 [Acaulospora morrowiae]|uniref:539_t:CDS:1 n=1 Tax=Acaulospora morrowiae TaxID=94023 RepID=A0A9N9FRL1_9GLOM|nr:539_t:CDS:2 [Acaulospora morrowiae]